MAQSGSKGRGMNGRMRRVWFVSAMGVLAFGLVGLSPGMLADDAGAAPAARAVRLSSVDGQVKLSQGGQVLTDQAVANVPLFEGTRVVTADEGRAEIQFEDGSVARISPNSVLTLTVLKGAGASAEAEIKLESGLGYFEVQGSGLVGTIRVKFGDSVVTPSGFTVLRVNLDNPPGELAVFSGNAHLEHRNAMAVDLHGGESVALDAGDPSHYTLLETIEPDSWDSWNSDRDQALSAEASARTPATKGYADGSNPGWNDLDANGSWYDVPGQGNVWSPYDASNPGWDPYGNGYWMNSPQAGYMWVSDNSWGYLPYQCGLWNWYDGFGWGWAPGFGGCRPWWFGGVYALNIGLFPGGYRPPVIPRQHGRILTGPGAARGTGLIAVNRRPSFAAPAALPSRDKTTVVTIAGHTAQPLHAVSARPQYARTGAGAATTSHVVINSGAGPVGAGRAFSSGQRAPGVALAPSRAPSGGGYSGGASASHASAGGGGGGGGGSHGGGGGGGGGAHR